MGRKRRSGGKREIPLMRERGDLFLVLSYLRRYFCDWLVDQIYVNRVYSRNELVAPLSTEIEIAIGRYDAHAEQMIRMQESSHCTNNNEQDCESQDPHYLCTNRCIINAG